MNSLADFGKQLQRVLPSAHVITHQHKQCRPHWVQSPGYSACCCGNGTHHMCWCRWVCLLDTQKEILHTHPCLGRKEVRERGERERESMGNNKRQTQCQQSQKSATLVGLDTKERHSTSGKPGCGNQEMSSQEHLLIFLLVGDSPTQRPFLCWENPWPH